MVFNRVNTTKRKVTSLEHNLYIQENKENHTSNQTIKIIPELESDACIDSCKHIIIPLSHTILIVILSNRCKYYNRRFKSRTVSQ